MSNQSISGVQRILVYKRVHNGDPGAEGIFGCNTCMGRIRGWSYDAVIGIGGISAEPQQYRIDRKINWIGIYPRKIGGSADKPLIEFQHFLPFRECGWKPREGQFAFEDALPAPYLTNCSDRLAKMFYRSRPPRFRLFTKDVDTEFDDALAILGMALTALPSVGAKPADAVATAKDSSRRGANQRTCKT
jgi:hypothetical protein